MSRYVEIDCPLRTLDEVATGLRAMGLAFERPTDGRVVLEGSLECVGEPVDIRLRAGVLGSVEDFGFVRRITQNGELVQLVCGELDRRILEADLLTPLRRHVVTNTIARMTAETGLSGATSVESDGTVRIVVRKR